MRAAARPFAFRLASPATALLLGGLVVVLAVSVVPLGILARQSIWLRGGSIVLGPVFGMVGFVVDWRRPRGKPDLDCREPPPLTAAWSL